MVSVKEQIIHELDNLTPEQQQRVLDLAKELQGALPLGTPGEVLLAHMDSFQFEPGDLEEMAQAIEESYERSK